MLAVPEPPGSFSARRALRKLLLFYSLLIVYGSFLPFYFNLDPNFLAWRWDTFVSSPVVPQVRNLLPDVISNILLFVPWGFLWVAVGKERQIFRSHAAPLVIGALGLLLGLSIECGQTLSPFRSPSKLDALCNGAGAVVGATFGYFFLRAARKNRGRGLRQLLSERPSLILLLILLLALAFEAAYPFRFTLDLSMISANLRRASFAYSARRNLWLGHGDWVAKLLFFTAVGFLLRQILKRQHETVRCVTIWVLSSLFGLLLEIAKVFVIGRIPRIENVLLAAAGSLVGICVVPKLAALDMVKRHPKEFLLLLTLGLIAYFELEPFFWVNSREIPRRIAAIERIPFITYYYVHPSVAVFDIAKKLFLSIPFGFVLAAWYTSTRPSKPALLRTTVTGTLLALVLETGQIWVRSRTPSVTDILLIGFGSWLGALAFACYRALTPSMQRSVTPDH